ncbi:MAG TPA: universal stress protein [Clostridia bacterium]|nr:universal stress protein [Clostridia bacterium]
MTVTTNPSPSAPISPRVGRIRTVMLATDLTQASDAATETALELASRLGARLLAVSVIDPGSLRLPGGRFRARIDQVRAEHERLATELVARGRSNGVSVDFLVWEGDPGESIVDAANSEAADMIIVGSHGRSTVGRFLIGSVSDHVVRHAPCPVLVVRSGSAGPGPAAGFH